MRWVDDESNRDDALTRNFLRLHVGPLLAARFPRWRESLARAAGHFAQRHVTESDALRQFLDAHGLKMPSTRKLGDMLRQLRSEGAAVTHDGKRLRVFRGEVHVDSQSNMNGFDPRPWKGEARLAIPELGGELRFRRVTGRGLAAVDGKAFTVRLRAGGERLQVDAKRPRRTLKNLFQEAGVPPWQRERLPLLFCGESLAWVPGVGIDTRFQARTGAPGWLPQWVQSGS